MVGVHPWQVALFADEAQQAVWGEDTNTRLTSSYAPTGKATLAEGGFTLSGRWCFCSGCDHCQWVLLGGLVFNAEGNVVDFKTFMVPRTDYTIVDVWNVVGLRGTGSNDIVVDDVFVPEAFTLSMSDTGRCRGPGQEQNTSDLYKLPFHSVFTDDHLHADHRHGVGRLRRARRDAAEARPGGLPRREGLARPVRRRADRARGQRDRRGLGTADAQHPRGAGAASPRASRSRSRLRLKVRRDQVLGTQRAIDAIDSLFEASGGRALAEGTYLQRAWRDAHAGRVHAANDPERALQMFGALEFGHKIDPGMY